MSQQNLPKATVIKPEKQHSERMYLLGGSWLAMVSLGMVGMSAIVNPDVKFPIIDPLLDKLAPQMVVTTEGTTAETADFSSTSIKGTATPAALAQTSTQISPESQPEPVAIETAQPSQSTSPDLIPQPSATSAMPAWFYVGVIASCIAGSSLITYLLYKATQQPTQPKKSPQKVRATVKVQKKQSSQSVRAMETQSPPKVKSPVSQRKIQVAEVAPLRIVTPSEVQPPSVKLEPVIDPQPTQLGSSKAAKMVAIAKNAKEASPKSLVEMMDIRRRGSLAPILQDL